MTDRRRTQQDVIADHLAARHKVTIAEFSNAYGIAGLGDGTSRYRAVCSCGYRSLPYATREAALLVSITHRTQATHNAH